MSSVNERALAALGNPKVIAGINQGMNQSKLSAEDIAVPCSSA